MRLDDSDSARPAGMDRFAGGGLLVALLVSSGIAFSWPSITSAHDPFLIHPWMLLALVAVTMYCLGIVLDRGELLELRQRPLSVLLGVLIQCTWMPFLAVLVVEALSLEGDIANGVLLVGCVPGAMASNVLTLTARGNVSYSVSLTTAATMLSPLTVPLTLMITSDLSASPSMMSPFRTAMILLATVVAPVTLGYFSKRLASTWSNALSSLAPRIASLALLWIIASVVAANRDRLSQVPLSWLIALLCMNLLGYAGGWFLGRLVGLPTAMRRALTLEVGMQNAGLGTALAATLFGTDSLTQIPTAAYTFGCMLTGTIVAGWWSRSGW
ncbi:MAG: bile acid:sodium symporter family protein [Planctomycetota bacterium]